MRLRRKPQTASAPWRVWVAEVGIQCEVCGVPTDACQVVEVKGQNAWVRYDPCGHIVSLSLDLEDAK